MRHILGTDNTKARQGETSCSALCSPREGTALSPARSLLGGTALRSKPDGRLLGAAGSTLSTDPSPPILPSWSGCLVRRLPRKPSQAPPQP
jgi:hypothetical protein